jgi:hypothetical protein
MRFGTEVMQFNGTTMPQFLIPQLYKHFKMVEIQSCELNARFSALLKNG